MSTEDIEQVYEIERGGDLTLQAGKSWAADGSDVPEPASIRLCSNGDIWVNGKLAANDQEVVDGLKEFIATAQRNSK